MAGEVAEGFGGEFEVGAAGLFGEAFEAGAGADGADGEGVEDWGWGGGEGGEDGVGPCVVEVEALGGDDDDGVGVEGGGG